MSHPLNYVKVKNYSDKQLLDRITKLPSFKSIPEEGWLLGVQSIVDTYNHFDDKIYVWDYDKCIDVLSATTNAGTTGLKNYNRYNSRGCAVIKTDEWYYDLWKYGLHKGKMPALRQSKPIKYYRDWNKNEKAEEIGPMYEGMIGINFHTVLYSRNMSFWRKLIGGWSVGCQVVNHVGKYYDTLDKLKDQDSVTYCLIKEF